MHPLNHVQPLGPAFQGREVFFIHHIRPVVSGAGNQRIHNRHPGGYRSNYRGRRDMGDLTRTDTEASGRMRWAHANRTACAGFARVPHTWKDAYSKTQG